jgi:uncharacterized protein YbjT (DUF2867 family)
MTEAVLVTGATGTVGSAVCAALRQRGRTVRAASRHPERLQEAGVERVPFDFEDPRTWSSAFRGVRTMFLVRPPALGRVSDFEPALRAGISAGLRHVVFLSVQGADRLAVLPHARIEAWLRSSPLSWTFLRPSFFDQNLITVHGPAIRRFSELVMPAGRGRTAFIDAVDLAEIAAGVLNDPDPHRGSAYTLTGTEALTYGEVAGIMTAVLSRTIRYRQPGLARYVVRARRDIGLSTGMTIATSIVYTTARLGIAGSLTGDAAELLGHDPGTMTEFITREQNAFRPQRAERDRARGDGSRPDGRGA